MPPVTLTELSEDDSIRKVIGDFEKAIADGKSDVPLDLSKCAISGRQPNFEAFTEWLSRSTTATTLCEYEPLDKPSICS